MKRRCERYTKIHRISAHLFNQLIYLVWSDLKPIPSKKWCELKICGWKEAMQKIYSWVCLIWCNVWFECLSHTLWNKKQKPSSNHWETLFQQKISCTAFEHYIIKVEKHVLQKMSSLKNRVRDNIFHDFNCAPILNVLMLNIFEVEIFSPLQL